MLKDGNLFHWPCGHEVQGNHWECSKGIGGTNGSSRSWPTLAKPTLANFLTDFGQSWPTLAKPTLANFSVLVFWRIFLVLLLMWCCCGVVIVCVVVGPHPSELVWPSIKVGQSRSNFSGRSRFRHSRFGQSRSPTLCKTCKKIKYEETEARLTMSDQKLRVSSSQARKRSKCDWHWDKQHQNQSKEHLILAEHTRHGLERWSQFQRCCLSFAFSEMRLCEGWTHRIVHHIWKNQGVSQLHEINVRSASRDRMLLPRSSLSEAFGNSLSAK